MLGNERDLTIEKIENDHLARPFKHDIFYNKVAAFPSI